MDTILLCTLTAIVIILAGGEVMTYSSEPMMMAIKSYSTVLGAWSEYFMCIAVLLFAFATIVCWAHYGKESLYYVTKRKRAIDVYVVLFALFVFVGAVASSDVVWLLADLSLGIMTIINLPVLFSMRGEVREETDKFFLRE